MGLATALCTQHMLIPSMYFQSITSTVKCRMRHRHPGRSFWWLHRIWVVMPPLRAAMNRFVGHCRPHLWLTHPPNYFIPSADIVWPLDLRQNFNNEMLCVAVNYYESFRQRVVWEFYYNSQIAAIDKLVYTKCTDLHYYKICMVGLPGFMSNWIPGCKVV